jgi:3-hydroxybutyrate dehydrogenase
VTERRPVLRDKCALVTGSTAGLGLAIADRLAAEGCRVVLNGLASAAEGARICEGLVRKHGVEARFHGADLSVPAQIAELMQFAGDVDILVNNAVTRHFAPVEAFPVEHWDESLAVNLSAAFHTIRLALPAMRRRGFGRIVNIASVYSFMGAVNRVDYVTTKAGLVGLTRAVALETAGTDITCNAVAPGVLPTEAILQRIESSAEKAGTSVEETTQRYLADRQPGGRFIPMESVAALIVVLCSPAGQGMTGAVFPVDGGWTIK